MSSRTHSLQTVSEASTTVDARRPHGGGERDVRIRAFRQQVACARSAQAVWRAVASVGMFHTEVWADVAREARVLDRSLVTACAHAPIDLVQAALENGRAWTPPRIAELLALITGVLEVGGLYGHPSESAWHASLLTALEAELLAPTWSLFGYWVARTEHLAPARRGHLDGARWLAQIVPFVLTSPDTTACHLRRLVSVLAGPEVVYQQPRDAVSLAGERSEAVWPLGDAMLECWLPQILQHPAWTLALARGLIPEDRSATHRWQSASAMVRARVIAACATVPSFCQDDELAARAGEHLACWPTHWPAAILVRSAYASDPTMAQRVATHAATCLPHGELTAALVGLDGRGDTPWTRGLLEVGFRAPVEGAWEAAMLALGRMTPAAS
jgi:hypothetical protein